MTEEIECYTCEECGAFFDRDEEDSWREPVEIDDDIYCQACHERMKGKK